jgi:GR25 family glycosyltransferase involved in LPS biosynthesis
MDINYFDAICYINLDHRKDRKKSILAQLKKMGAQQKKIIRIPAIQISLNGYKGAVLSHIKTLDYAIKNNLKNILILEDDCLFIKSKNITNQLLSFFFEKIPKWDVFLLGGKFFKKRKTAYPHIIKILKSSDSHAYVVNKPYMIKLKKCFLDAYKLIENEFFYIQSWETKISIFDIHWQKLQIKDNWFGLDTQIAIQNNLYSDNEKKQRDYIREITKI